MPKDLNPHISILDDPKPKQQVAKLAERNLTLADELQRHPFSPEQLEREKFQFESNALAEQNPLYAAARSASAFLVLPLEPQGTRPLVELSEATREPRQIFEWWGHEFPEANIGVLLGRVGGIFALKVEDEAAYLRLREMAAEQMHDPDNDRTWTEYRDLGGAFVRFGVPSQLPRYRMRTGWGKAFSNAAAKEDRELTRKRQSDSLALVWSYPHVTSGMDAFEYRSRTIGPGLRVIGEGEVLPWNGSILEDGARVYAPSTKPFEVPLWVARMLGTPRSRKAIAAAREEYERNLRGPNGEGPALQPTRAAIMEHKAGQAVKGTWVSG